MILRDDMVGFNMDVLKQALMSLRERTESSFYVHDLREKRQGNTLLNIRGVLSTGSKVAHITLQRGIDINDGDIITLRSADGRLMNYFVFDVEQNRFSPDKFTMHAVLWTLPMNGYGHRGGARQDDMHGRRSVWIESSAQKEAC